MTEYLREFEVIARKIVEILPKSVETRTRDVIQINYRNEKGIVILLTPEAMEIRLPTTDWTQGAYGPVSSSRLWKRIKFERLFSSDKNLLTNLLKEGLRIREREFKECIFCKKKYAMEHMTGNYCHSCASKHLGIVY